MLRVYLRELAELEDSQSASLSEPSQQESGYPFLKTYWHNERRIAFLIHLRGRPAGFSLVNDWSASGCPVDWTIAEFFIERAFRRRGVGRRAATQIFESLPGSWEVPVLEANAPAQVFWRTTVAAFVGKVPDELRGDGDRWQGPILRFSSPSRS